MLVAVLSREEEQIVESFIFLDIARKVLEKDLSRLQHAPLKIKEPYIRLIEAALEKLSTHMYRTKWEMKQADLQVQLQRMDSTFSEYSIFFRGYVVTAKYLNPHLRNQVSRMIEQLFTDTPAKPKQLY
ncbi:hypothetical protein [Salisediminibacterium halotolerans]|uniref:hypothetical protein n=1 Tax=Salisediminibacterium halotolerans TaxID=517425 RepID=UPI000B8030DA|nr:hypothetical protein [Salisediminibacterium haloalkalitolerans]